MPPLARKLYTAEATATGGRDGRARTQDGMLDLLLVPPRRRRPGGRTGTDPEQLFAAGYAACFQSAIADVARRDGTDVSGSEVSARVTLGMVDEGEYGLAVELRVHIPDLDTEQAARLVEEADAVCPYSNAVRGNIEVTLTVAPPAERATAKL